MALEADVPGRGDISNQDHGLGEGPNLSRALTLILTLTLTLIAQAKMDLADINLVRDVN